MSETTRGRGACDEHPLANLMEPVARRLLGDPNSELSSKGVLRYGGKGSLAIDLKKGTFFDHEANEGGGVLDLIRRERAGDPIAWLRDEKLIGDDAIVLTWPYCDEKGQLLFEVCKTAGKKFWQRRPDGNGGWINKLDGARRILYRLPELLSETGAIHIFEGEKDVDTARAMGLRATCNPGGAGKWKSEYSEFLRGEDVVIAPDNDDPGRAHAHAIARSAHGVARRIRVLSLHDLKQKGDLTEWREAGGTRERYLELAEAAPDWEPASDHQEEPKNREPRKKANQADALLAIAAREAELFRAPGGVGYADLNIEGHRETWPVRSRTFRRWLARRYFETTRGAPNSEARQSALNIIEAQASFGRVEREVCVRVAACAEKIYLDLADEAWRAVEVGSGGWRLIDDPPVRFCRRAGMRPLPVPTGGGSVNSLRGLLNVQSDADFTLIVAWVLAAMCGRGPYPVLVVAGEQGSAKSTVTAIVRRLTDPNTAPLRALPREERDLFIAANNAHVLAFDNVSGLPPWISDALCRLATGGGFATRELHTDQEEVLFDAVRPIILNGIEDVVTRPDLADRSIMLTLSPISDDRRRTERELWAEFDTAHPAVFGALLDALAHGLRELPNTKPKERPRMAEFATWIAACEGGLDLPMSFDEAYRLNRDQAMETVIEADPVAVAVRALMVSRVEWSGTATALLEALSTAAGSTVSRSRHWPSAPNALTRRLRRAATFLRKVGIEVDLGAREGHDSKKMVRITRPDGAATPEEEELPF